MVSFFRPRKSLQILDKMKQVIIACLCASNFATEISFKSDDRWIEFKAKYNKKYESMHHEETAFRTFYHNLEKIKDHNSKKSSYKKGVNQFTDLSFEELSAQRLMSLPYPEEDMEFECPTKFTAPEAIELPVSVDWRTEENPKKTVAVTAVKDQGACGSCYVFSATGTMEGSLCMNGYFNCTSWPGLSEQQVIDCASYAARKETKETSPVWYEGLGCFGGWPSNVIEYVYYNNGITCEGMYPYVSGTEKFDNFYNNQECGYSKDASHGYPDKHICGTPSGDGPDAIKMAQALYFKGPLSMRWVVKCYDSSILDQSRIFYLQITWQRPV